MMRNLFFAAISIGMMLAATISYSQTSVSKVNIKPSAVALDYLQALLKFEPWAESTWADYERIPGAGYFGDGQSDGNAGIRGTMCIAFTYGVLIDEFPDAPQRAHRLKRLEAALRYAEQTHESGPSVTIDGKKWGGKGNPWQANAWAASMGFVAAMHEKELDPKVIEGCKRVVAAEADYRSEIPPATGYKRNTRSEENAWQSNILSLAPSWMPDHPRAKQWIEAAKLYMANSYTVPADSSGPLKKWIMTQTLYPTYTLENHGFFHPSYQISGGMSLGDSYIMSTMLNPAVGKELKPFIEHNMMPVWSVVKNIMLDIGELAFPSGMDWALHQFEDVNYIAWMAVYFNKPEAFRVQPRLAKQILHRQSVNGDGRFVGESCRSGAGYGSTSGFYVEAIQSCVIAIAYLHNKMAGFPTDKGVELESQLTHYPDVGLITHRSKNILTTVSYGARAMSLSYPLFGKTPAQQLIISPNSSSMLGTDGKTTMLNFMETPTGFEARLQLNGIKSGRVSTMTIVSDAEAVVYVEIPSGDSQSSAKEWMLSAIENHPLTGKGRNVIWKGGSQMIGERSGAVCQPAANEWINIDDWMGYIAVTKGTFKYWAPKDYNREGAAEDSLTFRSHENNKPRAVIVLPGKNAAYTAAVQKTVKWLVSETGCKITYRVPGGKNKEIYVPLKQ